MSFSTGSIHPTDNLFSVLSFPVLTDRIFLCLARRVASIYSQNPSATENRQRSFFQMIHERWSGMIRNIPAIGQNGVIQNLFSGKFIFLQIKKHFFIRDFVRILETENRNETEPITGMITQYKAKNIVNIIYESGSIFHPEK